MEGASGKLNLLLSKLLAGAEQGLDKLHEGLGDASRVIRFLRGRLEFRSRPDDIFIVSYPRSGTTLMQMLLYQMVSDGDLDFTHISQRSPWFERALALGTCTAADFDKLDSPRVFKSHLPAGWIPEPGRCIYVRRDGMDVAASYFHFYRSHLGFRGDFDDFFERFMGGRLQYRSWFDHVASWEQRRKEGGVLFCDYEELTCRLMDCAQDIAGFCGLRMDQATRERIRHRCSFDYMKAYEEKFDHITRVMLDRGFSRQAFIRQGKSHSGWRLMSEEQRRRFQRMHARPRKPAPGPLGLADFLK